MPTSRASPTARPSARTTWAGTSESPTHIAFGTTSQTHSVRLITLAPPTDSASRRRRGSQEQAIVPAISISRTLTGTMAG